MVAMATTRNDSTVVSVVDAAAIGEQIRRNSLTLDRVCGQRGDNDDDDNVSRQTA